MNSDGVELNDPFGLNPSASEFIPRTTPQPQPSCVTPEAQTKSSIAPLDSIWKDSQSSSAKPTNKMVKFVQNVHFPKDFLNKCLRVLPPDVTLADVKYQPKNFQEKWFDYLEQRESEAVEKRKETEGANGESSLISSIKDSRFIASEKATNVRSVSKSARGGFVSSITQTELDSRVNKKFEDLSFFSSDFKEEFTALSMESDSKIVGFKRGETSSCSFKLYP